MTCFANRLKGCFTWIEPELLTNEFARELVVVRDDDDDAELVRVSTLAREEREELPFPLAFVRTDDLFFVETFDWFFDMPTVERREARVDVLVGGDALVREDARELERVVRKSEVGLEAFAEAVRVVARDREVPEAGVEVVEAEAEAEARELVLEFDRVAARERAPERVRGISIESTFDTSADDDRRDTRRVEVDLDLELERDLFDFFDPCDRFDFDLRDLFDFDRCFEE